MYRMQDFLVINAAIAHEMLLAVAQATVVRARMHRGEKSNHPPCLVRRSLTSVGPTATSKEKKIVCINNGVGNNFSEQKLSTTVCLCLFISRVHQKNTSTSILIRNI